MQLPLIYSIEAESESDYFTYKYVFLIVIRYEESF